MTEFNREKTIRGLCFWNNVMTWKAHKDEFEICWCHLEYVGMYVQSFRLILFKGFRRRCHSWILRSSISAVCQHVARGTAPKVKTSTTVGATATGGEFFLVSSLWLTCFNVFKMPHICSARPQTSALEYCNSYLYIFFGHHSIFRLFPRKTCPPWGPLLLSRMSFFQNVKTCILDKQVAPSHQRKLL